MLIEFRAKNFRSLCDQVELSMVASKLTAKNKALDRDNLFAARADLSLLKTAAIYGANAGGKSNVVRALRFMRKVVLESSRESQAGDPIAVEPFLLREDMARGSSSFEVVFQVVGVQYRYGFELDHQRIHAEWLFARQTSRERLLFERAYQTIELGPDLRKEGKGLDERTRANALFLSVFAQWNGELATTLVGWFQSLLILQGDRTTGHATLAQLRATGPERVALVELVKSLDLGIEDIKVETSEDLVGAAGADDEEQRLRRWKRQLSNPYSSVRTLHRGRSKDGDLTMVEFGLMEHESDGTQRLFTLAGPLLGVLARGEVLVVDELDMRLHPLMTCALIRLFHDPTTNPHNAQLIFTTHDANLLGAELLRRDQVWFIEKDRLGATKLYSLAEFKVRSDASFEKDYIRGKYGAIPFLGGLQRILDEVADD